ncbi:two-component system response regulator [Xanthobacter agilis]|uniref:Diguanylate cyclase (GGDEF)-like protein n=1 Tax=Xanthobacter agilis TaxID=47492 RepID=A0ABU0LF38_XANAG|nr:diguanylate cyclase [Xanthobacter agilis]MDQ0505746.1 diguanylate cyclase (GGDEF)-like protein [Xanthobacter agilis]
MTEPSGTEPRPKILVVDDVSANLAGMRRLLAPVDADIYEAKSGNEALALCLDHRFALILLDVQMPDMDGFEVASLLNNDPATCDIPIVFVTAAYLDDINRLKGYTFGAVDYIAKPINDAVLLSKVTVFLELHISKMRLKAAMEELEKRNRQLEVEIEERRRVEKQVRHMATHDSLTGLGNRILFMEHLTRAFAQARQNSTAFALLYIDIDGFKQVNDRHGHAAGDELLCAIAQRLRANLRCEDFAVRLSGDEFAIIMLDVADTQVALAQGQRLCDSLRNPYVLRQASPPATVSVGASIGIALYPLHAASDATLMRLADAAMYAVKKSGKGNVRLASLDDLQPSEDQAADA